MDLFQAVWQEKPKELLKILQATTSRINTRKHSYEWNGHFCAPIHLAAIRGNLTSMKILHRFGVKLNINDEDRWTPLHYATANGHLHCVKWLIRQKAELNSKDVQHNTPIHYAARSEQYQCIEALVLAGANLTIRNKHLETIFEINPTEEILTTLRNAIIQKEKDDLHSVRSPKINFGQHSRRL